jgi:two-component system cell cycle sensor histidine kinase/response regulator CckA
MENFPRILVVDDEPALLRMLEVFLARLRFQVTLAGATAEAWRMFAATPAAFDVAVLDASMREPDAPVLAARMLALSPAVRVLLSSGYPMDTEVLEAAAPGRVVFLHKPFTAEALETAIRRMVGAEEEDV